MRLLLDTHIYLWSLMDSRKLSKQAQNIIQEADEVFVSSASIWEASIKIGLGKLHADIAALISEITPSGFKELPVHMKHAALVCKLPDIHRDPFDRLLIAQTLSEPLHFLTADAHLSAYTELVISL